MVAGELCPSLRVTVTVPPLTPEEITWLLVRMCPSASMISPEPVPPDCPRAVVTEMVTTEGSTSLATASASQLPTVLVRDHPAPHVTTAPTTPPTSATTERRTHGNQPRRRR